MGKIKLWEDQPTDHRPEVSLYQMRGNEAKYSEMAVSIPIVAARVG